jgi:hypothetical protein
MPIRHCQKCGLKVLIDESQAATSPFYCQRCTTSIKNEGGGAAESAPPRPRAGAAPGGKPGTVKVQCPYCKASFNGRIPQKPARGACPVCQKELILLPNGDIRSASGFDPLKWQREQTAPGDQGPESEAAPEAASSRNVRMPSWMDEAGAAPPSEEAAPAPEPEAPAPEPEAPMPEAAAEAVIKSIEPMPEEVPPALEPFPPPPEEPAPEPAPEEAPPEPPVEEAPPPPPPPPKPLHPTVRKPEGAPPVAARGTARRGVDVAASAATGTGKIVLAFFLMIIPVISCPILYNGRGGLQGPIDKIGTHFSKGFHALYLQICPPPKKPRSAAPPPEEKKAGTSAEEKARPGPADQKRDEEEIQKLWGDYMREKRTVDQKAVGATDAEKEMIQKAQDEIKKKLDAVNELRARYKTTYGKDFDPKEQ